MERSRKVAEIGGTSKPQTRVAVRLDRAKVLLPSIAWRVWRHHTDHTTTPFPLRWK